MVHLREAERVEREMLEEQQSNSGLEKSTV